MHALDRRELRDAFRLKPIEEFRRGARTGAARVRVPDLGRGEFEEAIGGALADDGDEGGGHKGTPEGEGVSVRHPCTPRSASSGIIWPSPS